mmetsp:Transcript_3465/g.4263  ORF Transcript_3465/g.4263 Transcript_3465/m.4263 type:complete len:404 (+) Transcript_3465:144-1355(+)
MSDEKRGSETFDSEKFLRRLERERRLKEIEQSFQNIAEEAQKKQDDIYSNVFTEKGQEETLASHGSIESNNNFQASQNTTDNTQNGIFSRMTDMISPSRQKLVQNQSIEMSPTGVSSFPGMEPVGGAKRGKNAFWNNDGPGIAARMSNARVQNTIIHSFFSVRANSKKIIIGLLAFCFIILLSVTLANVKKSPHADVLSESGWRKLEEIKSTLVDKGVNRKKLDDKTSSHFDAIVWLSQEATEYSQTFVNDRRLLVERFTLLVFYYSTRTAADPWKNEANWLTKGVSICLWRGIDCERLESDDEDTIEVVVHIDLSSNNLSGTISDEISKLSSLKTLRLSDNRLEGNVPASLGELKHLETFEVGENRLSGQMPSSVCDLKEFRLTDIITDCAGFSCSCCNECG